MDIQLKKGVLDVCVLYAISKGESYGYKIISDLQGIIDISESNSSRNDLIEINNIYKKIFGGRL